jgi:hypothetical protein
MDIAGKSEQALVYLNTDWGSRYSFARPETPGAGILRTRKQRAGLRHRYPSSADEHVKGDFADGAVTVGATSRQIVIYSLTRQSSARGDEQT